MGCSNDDDSDVGSCIHEVDNNWFHSLKTAVVRHSFRIQNLVGKRGINKKKNCKHWNELITPHHRHHHCHRHLFCCVLLVMLFFGVFILMFSFEMIWALGICCCCLLFYRNTYLFHVLTNMLCCAMYCTCRFCCCTCTFHFIILIFSIPVFIFRLIFGFIILANALLSDRIMLLCCISYYVYI